MRAEYTRRGGLPQDGEGGYFFDDGATFIDQTEQPVEFPCADGWMPPAFIDAVRGMAVGETRRVRVSANEAYEERTEESA